MYRLNAIRKIFAPPIFEDDEKTRSAYFINIIVLSNIPILLVFIIIRTNTGAEFFGIANIILSTIIAILIIVWSLMRQGQVRLAGYLHITTIWLASTMIALNGSGIRGTAFTSYFVVMLMAGLLLGWRPAIGFTILSIIATFGLAVAENKGLIDYIPGSAISVAIEGTILFLFGAIFLYLIINSLQNAARDAKTTANELKQNNQELTKLRSQLELRIHERTSALEKRAVQLQAVSSVARTIASFQELDTLLPGVTNLVSEQFGFYHVGIFLLDEKSEYAVLRAANSQGGARMLERQHKLLLDSNSIVGYSTSHGEARIALDVGADAVFFNNPDLPDTRSEMALPLRARDRTIGALDVQSKQSNAFTEEDIATLGTLADQITIAIENARLFENARMALAEAQSTFEKYVKQDWENFSKIVKHKGFVFDGKQVLSLDNDTWQEKTKIIPQTGSLSLKKTSSTLAVPIKLRGQTIGILDVRAKQGQREWSKDEISLLEAAAERAALALENARLVETSERRAAREHVIGDISTRIGSFSDMDSILQTAVEELGRRIGGAAEVTIEIDSTESTVI